MLGQVGCVIGWTHPALVCIMRYENTSLFIDGTFCCLPNSFKQCMVVMMYDRGTELFVPVFYVLYTVKTHLSTETRCRAFAMLVVNHHVKRGHLRL